MSYQTDPEMLVNTQDIEYEQAHAKLQFSE